MPDMTGLDSRPSRPGRILSLPIKTEIRRRDRGDASEVIPDDDLLRGVEGEGVKRTDAFDRLNAALTSR
jgi:hypothetical protein